MEDREIRAALDRHWAASDANDLEAEGRTSPFGGEGGKFWNRRILVIAGRSGEGPLTEPTAAGFSIVRKSPRAA